MSSNWPAKKTGSTPSSIAKPTAAVPLSRANPLRTHRKQTAVHNNNYGLMTITMPFVCSICEEQSTRICVKCPKDTCANHLCEKCASCSDCCDCEIRLEDEGPHEPQPHPHPMPDPDQDPE